MLYLHTSNQLEQLAKQFCLVTGEPFDHPQTRFFDSEKVIVQNAGMARWLSLRVAQQTGISANMETLFPAEFMWRLLRMVIADLPEQDPCAPASLRWRLFMVFLEELGDPEADFPELTHYLKDETSAWDLAGELSRLLDQYLFYRDDWIREWETNSETHWQARLWRKVVSDNGLVHWLSMQDQFIEALKNLDPKTSALPQRVSFFSLSALSPGYLRLLGELGKIIDIHLFIINPCQEYWGDILSEKQIARLDPALQDYYEAGNPLLSSLGKQGRDFIDQCLDLPDIQLIDQWRVNEQATSLLAHLQGDILALRFPRQGKERADGGLTVDGDLTADGYIMADGSVQFHACHTPMREVEVLRDQILDILQNDPECAPSDIVVMMPDVELYAPYIEAVFSTPPDKQSKTALPFSIADRSPSASQQIIEIMLKILALPRTRFDVESVFELLDYEALRKPFDLQQGDVIEYRELARAVNIRWGVSATSRRYNGLPETDEHTWRYALDRMLLGYMMPGETLFDPGNAGYASPEKSLPLLPYDQLEGSKVQLLARLKRFTDTIFTLDEWSRQNKTLQAWLQQIRSFIRTLFKEDNDASALLDMLDEMRQQIETAGLAKSDNKLPFAVISKIMKQALQGIKGREKFLGYGITFCALTPMRSVPFKVVALLGMNDGDFPRHTKKHGFDLSARQTRKGDRSQRDEDRYLFLESLLAARKKLIISFVGQSVKDNATLPPSVVVSELLDAIASYLAVEPTQLICKHPLQAFSPRYYMGDPRLFSYAQDYAELYQQTRKAAAPDSRFIKKPLETLDDAYKQVHLSDLIRFYINPARFFLQQRFAVQTYDDDLTLPIREPFSLGRFDEIKIRDALLSHFFHTSQAHETDRAPQSIDADEMLLISRAKGLLPYGDIGDHEFNDALEIVNNFIQQLPEQPARDNLGVKLALGDFTLHGEIDQLLNNHEQGVDRLSIQGGKPYARDYIKLWLKHLALNAATQSANSQGGTSYFYSPEQSFGLSPVEDAAEILHQLLTFYWKGLHFPLRFFPKSAFNMMEKNPQNPNSADAIKTWQNDYFGHAERDRFEHWLLYHEFDNNELFDQEFMNVSMLVYGILFQSLFEIIER